MNIAKLTSFLWGNSNNLWCDEGQLYPFRWFKCLSVWFHQFFWIVLFWFSLQYSLTFIIYRQRQGNKFFSMKISSYFIICSCWFFSVIIVGNPRLIEREIRHERSYKQLQVKTKLTSFICGNSNNLWCDEGQLYPFRRFKCLSVWFHFSQKPLKQI
jgi:hypothetical protein